MTHTYAAAGVYDAVVTVTDGDLMDTAGVGVAVNSGAVDQAVFAISSTSVKLNLKTANKDALTVSGTLPVDVGFSPDGEPADIYFGGIKTSFVLNDKASSSTANSSFKILGKIKNGAFTSAATKFTFSLKDQSLLSSLPPPGFTNTTVIKPGLKITIPVIVTLNGKSVTMTVTVNYTSKQGASGSAK